MKNNLDELSDDELSASYEAYRTLLETGMSKAQALSRTGLTAQIVKDLEAELEDEKEDDDEDEEDEDDLGYEDEATEEWGDDDEFEDDSKWREEEVDEWDDDDADTFDDDEEFADDAGGWDDNY